MNNATTGGDAMTYAGFQVVDITDMGDDEREALPESTITIDRDGGLRVCHFSGDMTLDQALKVEPEIDCWDNEPGIENAESVAFAALVRWAADGCDGPTPRTWSEALEWAEDMRDLYDGDHGSLTAAERNPNMCRRF